MVHTDTLVPSTHNIVCVSFSFPMDFWVWINNLDYLPSKTFQKFV